MFQYVIDTLTEKIKNEKVNLEEKKQEKESIEKKLNLIRTYNDLKKSIKVLKVDVGMYGAYMLLVGFLFLSLEVPGGLYLTLSYDGLVGCLALQKVCKLKNVKKAMRINCFKDIDKSIENQESMEELSKNLEKDIENKERVIHEYEEELKRVSIVDEFESNPLYNQPLYQADTKEEYELLRRKQAQEMMPFEEFLNEPVDYGNIHLQVSKMDRDKKVFVKKK